MRWCSVIRSWNYRSMHSPMHRETHNWLKQGRIVFIFFFQSKFTERQVWVSSWEYSSEHNGAYGLAASHPITSIILTLQLQYVLWNRPNATRFIEKSWPTSRNQTRSPRRRNTWIGKVGNGSVASKENSLSAGSEAGRNLVNRKPASLTGTQGTKRGDAK